MAILVLRCQKLVHSMHRTRIWQRSWSGTSWSLELYLETPGRSRPKNELYRRVSTSATIFARNYGLNIFFDKVMVLLSY